MGRISEPAAGTNTNMASGGDGITPKSALVTTHTARRSAATNLLLDGIPISEIMQLGGWKNEATLRHYLLAGGIQLARLSADREFFLCRGIIDVSLALIGFAGFCFLF